MSESYEVQLAVYDLSRGMARSLSAQFLGPSHSIEIIPHSALIVYGHEYYFGSNGIQKSDPSAFRQMHGIFPIEVKSLGRTTVDQQHFESWCMAQVSSSNYAGHNYDLLSHNCNNFANDAAKLGLHLSTGVPEWILNVPERFLASPMGQMMRPMLEQMQVAGPSGGSSNGWGAAASTATTSNPNANVAAISSGGNAAVGGNTNTDYNPWANLSPAEPSSTPSMHSLPIPSAKKLKVDESSSAKEETKKKILRAPVLNKHNQPLLSSDTNLVNICIPKIKQACGNTSEDGNIIDRLELLLSDKQTEKLQSDMHQSKKEILTKSVNLLLSLCASSSAVQLYALMMLRLTALQSSISSDEKIVNRVLQEVSLKLMSTHEETTTSTTSTAAAMSKREIAMQSMSWCVLSNTLGKAERYHYNSLSSSAIIQDLADKAIIDISLTKPVEIRQSAAAFLYNLTFFLTDSKQPSSDTTTTSTSGDHDNELDDVIVSILCGVFADLSSDTDCTTLLRRLLVVGKIIIIPQRNIANGSVINDDHDDDGHTVKVNETASSLLVEIGFLDDVVAVLEMDDLSENHKLLAEEIVEVLKAVA